MLTLNHSIFLRCDNWERKYKWCGPAFFLSLVKAIQIDCGDYSLQIPSPLNEDDNFLAFHETWPTSASAHVVSSPPRLGFRRSLRALPKDSSDVLFCSLVRLRYAFSCAISLPSISALSTSRLLNLLPHSFGCLDLAFSLLIWDLELILFARFVYRLYEYLAILHPVPVCNCRGVFSIDNQ